MRINHPGLSSSHLYQPGTSRKRNDCPASKPDSTSSNSAKQALKPGLNPSSTTYPIACAKSSRQAINEPEKSRVKHHPPSCKSSHEARGQHARVTHSYSSSAGFRLLWSPMWFFPFSFLLCGSACVLPCIGVFSQGSVLHPSFAFSHDPPEV